MLLLLGVTLALMAGLTAVERWRNPGATDWAINLQSWVINMAIALMASHFWPRWLGGSLIDAARLPLWLGLPLFFLLRDFLEWFYHLCQHRIPALWAIHSLHHSDPEMTALTTNRHFWGDQLVKSLTIWSATGMLIDATDTILAIYGAVSLYNYFIHANLRIDFGRLSWLLNCPAYHRRHHSRLPEHYDSNLAALFPIWDVLFGTYRRPDGWPPCGLDEGKPESLTELVTWPVRSRADADKPALGEA
ncbi:sterol desaturase family protein [Novosphingobium bradum]|uniref:Sterol desaturase family protein n=1 Tax=Novosphingobium bradum TaxID=1737444 RepID=A0ABV7IR41_9SPHN